MAQALPVITTPNCANVITHDVDGLIIPARDNQSLVDAIAKFDGDRELLRELSANALQTVQKYKIPANGLAIQHQAAQFRNCENGGAGVTTAVNHSGL